MTDTPQTVPGKWQWLGRLLQVLSYLKIPFFALGVYFQVKAMFFSTGPPFLDNLNRTLLMYGIAMSFDSLRDENSISEKGRSNYLAHRKMWQWIIAVVFIGGLYSIGVGCIQFFLVKNSELGWAITVFGLGMISLGRQRYNQFTSIFSAARSHSSE